MQSGRPPQGHCKTGTEKALRQTNKMNGKGIGGRIIGNQKKLALMNNVLRPTAFKKRAWKRFNAHSKQGRTMFNLMTIDTRGVKFLLRSRITKINILTTHTHTHIVNMDLDHGMGQTMSKPTSITRGIGTGKVQETRTARPPPLQINSDKRFQQKHKNRSKRCPRLKVKIS